jgi:branched-chain amino acid transport system permease protein
MVIMGGAANNGGVALGSFSFLFLFKTLDIVKLHVQLPVDMNWIEYILFASILISVLIFRPGGILPEKSSKTLPRETVAAIMETSRRDDGRPKEQTAATLQAATPDTERRD